MPVSVSACNSVRMTVDTNSTVKFVVSVSVRHLLTEYVVYMLILLQERESIKFDHFVCDPRRTKEISNSFGHKKHYLKTKLIRENVTIDS
jgi:hypothetical protein